MKFDKSNIEHLNCVRDIEMEIRLSYTSPDDEYNELRQYIRDVINSKQLNNDVMDVYNWIVNLINQTTNELKNNL